MSLKLIIPRLIYKEIMHYVDKAPGEISGLGTLTLDEGVFTVGKVVLCKQKNTGSTTDLDADDVATAMFQLKDEPGDMRFWWHSHADMGVFWSTTDHETMAELAEHGWFLSTVFNKKREMKTCLTFKHEVFGLYDQDSIKTEIDEPAPQELVDSWDENFKLKCEVEKPKVVTYPKGKKYKNYNQGMLPLSEVEWQRTSWRDEEEERVLRRYGHLTAKMKNKTATAEEEVEFMELLRDMDYFEHDVPKSDGKLPAGLL